MAKAAGVQLPPEAMQDPAVLAVRVQAIEDALQRLVQAQAANHSNLHQAFSLTDAHLWVLKMICIDIVEEKIVAAHRGRSCGPTDNIRA